VGSVSLRSSPGSRLRAWSRTRYVCCSAAGRSMGTALDVHLWRLADKWACHGHPHKPRPWIVNWYFGRYNPDRQDRWVFGDRNSGAYIPKFAWTKSSGAAWSAGMRLRTTPAQAGYWAERRSKNRPLFDRRTLSLLAGSTDPARSAGNCSCTPTASHKAHKSGNSGTAPPARRSLGKSSPSMGTAYRTTRESRSSRLPARGSRWMRLRRVLSAVPAS
jgi:hypothetical protein